MAYETIIINIPEVLKKAGIRPGQTVADLGTGREGRFALAAGRVIGEYGKVWAVDIIKDLLPSIETKATMLGINNVKTVWSDLEVFGGAKNTISDKSVDIAILATVLYQSKKHQAMIEEAIRMLKDNGKLIIVDWLKKDTPFGPPMESRIDFNKIKQMTAKLDLQLLEEFNTGKFYYALIFQK